MKNRENRENLKNREKSWKIVKNRENRENREKSWKIVKKIKFKIFEKKIEKKSKKIVKIIWKKNREKSWKKGGVRKKKGHFLKKGGILTPYLVEDSHRKTRFFDPPYKTRTRFLASACTGSYREKKRGF